MNKEELNRLLDNIYELEGLVHLALAREDCPESLPGLIIRKANALTQLVNEIGATDGCGRNETGNTPEYNEVKEYEEVKEYDEYKVEDSEEVNEQNESTNEVCVDHPEFTSYSTTEEGVDLSGNKPEDVTVEEIVEPTKVVEPIKVVSLEDDLTEPEPEKIASVDSNPPKNVEPRGKLVFTINDRYRFKRDLFCNSDADFNTTLALVASMDSYDEAEDYFLGELQWNPKREEVMDFLEILKNYFK